MAKGVFLHRSDSIYDDVPAERYQFPRQYLSRVEACVGDWIVYLEPGKVSGTRGYFAIARVQEVIPDPSAPDMFIAIIAPGSYLDFGNPVPFRGAQGIVERSVLNETGAISGRAQAAVRVIPEDDFERIRMLGVIEEDGILPRASEPYLHPGAHEPAAPFVYDIGDRASQLVSRTVRDRNFRRIVLDAYNERCAMTGLKLINGGGRAEVEAAHIKPVKDGGPDIVSNGLALCGTAHWMFDRGLIGVDGDMGILVSRQVNDVASIEAMMNRDRMLRLPQRTAYRPHPSYLQWHRENCFKQ